MWESDLSENFQLEALLSSLQRLDRVKEYTSGSLRQLKRMHEVQLLNMEAINEVIANSKVQVKLIDDVCTVLKLEFLTHKYEDEHLFSDLIRHLGYVRQAIDDVRRTYQVLADTVTSRDYVKKITAEHEAMPQPRDWNDFNPMDGAAILCTEEYESYHHTRAGLYNGLDRVFGPWGTRRFQAGLPDGYARLGARDQLRAVADFFKAAYDLALIPCTRSTSTAVDCWSSYLDTVRAQIVDGLQKKMAAIAH